MFLIVSIYKFFPNFSKSKSFTESASIQPELNEPKNSKDENTIIYVDLSGAVLKPGVYKMPVFSRVGDLITQGGGFTKNASVLWISRNLNLARPLKDTQKIYVPFEWETYGDCNCAINTLYIDAPLVETYSSNKDLENTDVLISESASKTVEDEKFVTEKSTISSSTSISNSKKININSATSEDLDSLSGIGPAYASKIISNRPYSNFLELVSKSGVPKNTLQKISGEIVF